MKYRKTEAFERRQQANQLATDRPHKRQKSNGDEQKFRHDAETAEKHDCKNGNIKDKPSFLLSFTKGLPHNSKTGLVDNPDDFQLLVKGIDSGDPRDFRDIPLGHKNHKAGQSCLYKDSIEYDADYNENAPKVTHGGDIAMVMAEHNVKEDDKLGWESEKIQKLVVNEEKEIKLRAWESQSAGNAFELEGPDAQAVTMPPAPKLGSEELTAEMAEVYAQALLRDIPFNAYSAGVVGKGKVKHGISHKDVLDGLATNVSDVNKVKTFTNKLNKLGWFSSNPIKNLNQQEEERRRCFTQTPCSAFRGITKGDNVGPYISQFLLAGNSGINGNDAERSPAEGLISYGAISAEQKVRKATEGKDYMTNWKEWLDVQNGADLRGFEQYDQLQKRRFIHTPRDLATYVHYDALYEAYLNACLIMLGIGIPFDQGIPFQQADNVDHQQGFAHFGGPHILSLVTEVATRALKAVRFQKFNVHRRCRPEVLAARIEKAGYFKKMAHDITKMKDDLTGSGLLQMVKVHNFIQNGDLVLATDAEKRTALLPMAFCEGSPMHPAYGAGHATVAGACVTILKAFFDHNHPLNIVPESELGAAAQKLIHKVNGCNDFHAANLAYVSVENGERLEVVPVLDKDCKLAKLTVEGELNKLASNISIGRNWAGVHYFTDYYESLLMGEQIAIGILEEQKLMFNENFSMTVPLFNGDTIRI